MPYISDGTKFNKLKLLQINLLLCPTCYTKIFAIQIQERKTEDLDDTHCSQKKKVSNLCYAMEYWIQLHNLIYHQNKSCV